MYRTVDLLNEFVEDAGVAHAVRPPVEMLSSKDRAANKITEDNEYPDYKGDDKTHPPMQKFLDEFGYTFAKFKRIK